MQGRRVGCSKRMRGQKPASVVEGSKATRRISDGLEVTVPGAGNTYCGGSGCREEVWT